MSVLAIAVRAVAAYLFLLVLLRVSGKRLLSEATGMQFVLAIMMGDLVDDAMLATVPFAQLIVAAGTLGTLQILIALAAMLDLRLWNLIEGEPPVVLQNGIPRRDAMRRERMNRKEIASLLRLAGISAARWAEIKRARVEEEGILAVIFHDWAKPAQRNDAEWVRTRMQRRG
ncbi:MAG TPA: YetF domain-containing protein [Gemmatimonadaceae bacterium]|nr:YetF domain-containing protein [Gemmatimonadaceae bacterium]